MPLTIRDHRFAPASKSPFVMSSWQWSGGGAVGDGVVVAVGVGSDVGTSDGAPVGASVGTAVGSSVGMADGGGGDGTTSVGLGIAVGTEPPFGRSAFTADHGRKARWPAADACSAARVEAAAP
jgi:hypothetical protein